MKRRKLSDEELSAVLSEVATEPCDVAFVRDCMVQMGVIADQDEVPKSLAWVQPSTPVAVLAALEVAGLA